MSPARSRCGRLARVTTANPAPRRASQREAVSVKGIFRAQQVVERDGRRLPLAHPDVADVRAALAAKAAAAGIELQDLVRHNLVVNPGRLMLCRQLAGDVDTRIYAVQMGDCKIGGVVSKSTHPADLSDNRLVQELRTLGGAPGGTFELDGYEFPAQVTKAAPAGLPGTLAAGGVSTLTDATADFITAGVTDDDVVNVVIGGEDYTLAVRAVLGATQLEVENPGAVAGAGIAYTVTTPQGEVLFRKFISGNNFPEATFGPMTIVHEAGLLFTTGALFNRVVFAPSNPNVGLVFQPQDINGVTLGIQVDWLIVI